MWLRRAGWESALYAHAEQQQERARQASLPWRLGFQGKKLLFKPEKERTPEEQSRFLRWREEQSGVAGSDARTKSTKESGGAGVKGPQVQFTSDYSKAQGIQFIPRVMTVDLTAELRAGYDAARELWGWDVSFGQYLSIITKQFFLDRGIKLGGYVIIETDEERAQRLQTEERTAEGNGRTASG